MDVPETISGLFVLLAVIGLAQAVLLTVWSFETTRFFCSRLRARIEGDALGRAQVFMPCKGVEPRFVDTVRSMLAQEYPRYRLTFVVEAMTDPAWSVLQQLLQSEAAKRAELVIAGRAERCGQKVFNLLRATEHLRSDTELVVFADSDIVPDRHWLRRIVTPLARQRTGAVTGYRWFIASAGVGPACLLAALNSSVAFALGNHPWNQVWGGSWAMRRATFEALRAAAIWDGALTEDLQIAPFVRQRGEYVAFEPGCLVASPVQLTWSSLCEFARRQYLITRTYAPRLWWFALITQGIAQGVFWGGCLRCVAQGIQGEPPTTLGLLLLAIYGLGLLRAIWRQRAIRRRFGQTQRAVYWLDLLAQPVLGLIQLGLMLASAWGREITWRSIQYRLHSPHHTEIIARGEPTTGRQAA